MFENNFDSGKDSSTRSKIIHILGYEWPLSARKIYFILKKRYKINCTYQAVYKSINEMKQKDILIKNKKEYHLNLNWIKQIHDETEMIRVNYYAIQKAMIFGKQESSTEELNALIFKNWFDVEKYLYYLQKNFILNSKEKEIIIFNHSHEWRPIFYLRAEYNWIKKLNELGHKTYTFCSGNTKMDKWSADFYHSLGCNIKLNEKTQNDFETMIFRDMIINIYIPLELKKALENYFNKTDIKNIDPEYLIKNIFEKPAEIKVIINKDKSLSSELKKNALEIFKKG